MRRLPVTIAQSLRQTQYTWAVKWTMTLQNVCYFVTPL